MEHNVFIRIMFYKYIFLNHYSENVMFMEFPWIYNIKVFKVTTCVSLGYHVDIIQVAHKFHN
jgi:hypothetical protein